MVFIPDGWQTDSRVNDNPFISGSGYMPNMLVEHGRGPLDRDMDQKKL